MSLVHSVDALKVAIEKRIPPNWVIEGTCTTPSAPSGETVLSRVEYIEPPEDGVQEYQLLYTVSDSPGGQVLTKNVPFRGRLDEVPDWCQGVRILAATNVLQWLRSTPLNSAQLYGPDGKSLPLTFATVKEKSLAAAQATPAGGDWPFPLKPDAGLPQGLRNLIDEYVQRNGSLTLDAPFENLDTSALIEMLVDAQGKPLLTADMASTAQAWRCERHKLASYGSWVQFKVKKLRLYKKERTTTHSLEVCYADPRESISKCLDVGFAAAVAAFVASGGTAAVPAFEAAFKTCIAAAGISLSQNIKVSVHTSNDWSGWKRV